MLTQVSVESDDPETVVALNHVGRVVRTSELHGSIREPTLVLPKSSKVVVVPVWH